MDRLRRVRADQSAVVHLGRAMHLWCEGGFAPRSAIHANRSWALLMAGERSARVFQQTPEGAESVFPANLLSFFVGPAGVADADFVNAQSTFGDFSRDLRFKSEAVLEQHHGLDYFPAESLVTGLHVAEIEICEGIGKKS